MAAATNNLNARENRLIFSGSGLFIDFFKYLLTGTGNYDQPNGTIRVLILTGLAGDTLTLSPRGSSVAYNDSSAYALSILHDHTGLFIPGDFERVNLAG